MYIPDSGRVTGKNHDSPSMTDRNRCSGEEHIGLILFDSHRVLDRACILADALALASEDRLVDTEGVAHNGNYTAVSGYPITDCYVDNIAGDKFFSTNPGNMTIPNNFCFVGGIFLKGSNRLFSTAFLGDTHNRVKNQDSKDLDQTSALLPKTPAGNIQKRITHNSRVDKSCQAGTLLEKS